MISMLSSLIGLIPGLAEKFLDWQVKRANVELEGFKTGATVDMEAFKSYLGAQVENNRLKLAQNAWWGAKVIILCAGLPASIHFGAVMLDSMPLPGHAVGSWGIAALPKPYDTYQWAIVQSFFLVMPVQTLASAAAQWLNRGRR
jgi:hypothetical protein